MIIDLDEDAIEAHILNKISGILRLGGPDHMAQAFAEVIFASDKGIIYTTQGRITWVNSYPFNECDIHWERNKT